MMKSICIVYCLERLATLSGYKTYIYVDPKAYCPDFAMLGLSLIHESVWMGMNPLYRFVSSKGSLCVFGRLFRIAQYYHGNRDWIGSGPLCIKQRQPLCVWETISDCTILPWQQGLDRVWTSTIRTLY